MAEFRKVANVSDIGENEVKSFQVGLDRVVICNVGSKFYALADECSHDSAPIGEGELVDSEIVCPRHGARFSVIDGSVTGPPAVVPIDTYQIKVEGGEIYVMLD